MSKGTRQIVLKEVTIDCKLGERTTFLPFGDIHDGSDAHSESTWKYYVGEVKYLRSLDRRLRFIGMGDYQEDLAMGDRRKLEATMLNLHDGGEHILRKYRAATDAFIRRKVRALVQNPDEELIGFLEGNHHAIVPDGQTTTQYMAEQMGTTYLSTAAYILVLFRCAGSSIPMLIFARHKVGRGAVGRLPGGEINKAFNMGEVAVANVLLLAHNHQRGGVDRQRLTAIRRQGGPMLKAEPLIPILTGGFARNYQEGLDLYTVDIGCAPATLGAMQFTVRPVRMRVQGQRHLRLHYQWGTV